VERDDSSAFAIWITGLPASGKSTFAAELSRQLRELQIRLSVLESDALRKVFSTDPQYDEKDRDYFYASLAFIGHVLIENGISVIFDATANRRGYRDRARQQIKQFLEIFVECPLEVCIQRDPKGIYRKAREGQAAHVPGLQTPYEPPEHPDFVVHGDREDPTDAARRVIAALGQRGLIDTKRLK